MKEKISEKNKDYTKDHTEYQVREKESRRPDIATDAIIEYDSGSNTGIILIERKYFPKKIALPGGMAEYGISLPDNVKKECKEETGLEVKILDEGQPFMVNSRPDRDPRGHIISIAYIVKGYGEIKPDEKEDAKRAWLCGIEELKEMFDKDIFAFDHEHIIKEYMVYKGYMKKWK